jgi:hypothetical protein
MPNEKTVVELKRLGTDLRELKTALRQKYHDPSQQVSAPEIKSKASSIAESWLADFSQRAEVVASASQDILANLTVHFQRILTFAERGTLRKRYDAEITDILRHFTTDVVVPVMQGRVRTKSADNDHDGVGVKTKGLSAVPAEPFSATAFVGHSFSEGDKEVVDIIISVLKQIGFAIETGEKPQPDRISEKVKRLIESQQFFVGIFTRRDKLSKKESWNTSAWVIDEKAYASAKNRKLILFREAGVDSIGGIQGDYEYIPFRRQRLQEAILKLLELFDVSVSGLRS